MEEKSKATKNQEDTEVEIVEDEGAIVDKINKLKKSLEICRKEKEEYLNGWQRAKADFINKERVGAQRQESEIKNRESKIIREILSVIDSFEKALLHPSQDQQWAEGIKRIYNQMMSMLSGFGVEVIRVYGMKFNPEQHEAVAMEECDTEDKDDDILEEMQKGYTIQGHVLRPTKVKVAKYNK